MFRRSLTCVCWCSGRILSAPLSQTVRLSSIEYKSQYSLDKIYPNSKEDHLQSANYKVESRFTPDGRELFSGYIPIKKLDIKSVRSSGPGGQNVNKVNSKVEVRFHVESAEWIPQWIRERILEKEHGRISKEGHLIITSDVTRKQMLNQADCMEKIRTIIFNSSQTERLPTEEEKEIKEQRIAKVKKAVLREKRHHSLKKQNRQSPGLSS